MKRIGLSALAALGALSVLSCSAEPKGQIILAIKTDMSLPKDIDRIRIVVTYADTNGVVFANTYSPIGEAPIRLPATLSLVAAEEVNRPIRVKVLAFRGGNQEDPVIRVIRDSVTTVPKDRVVTLPVPIEFLCDGSARIKTDPATGKPTRDEDGQLIYESSCGDGLTCKAGKCVTEEIPPADLPDFDEGEVFGGGTGNGDGTCFDTISCFAGATTLDVNLAEFETDSTKCRASAVQGSFNVGLETQGSGVCNDKGCYVPLDAQSESGWELDTDGQSIVLPTAVCQKLKAGEVARVLAAPAGQTPTCTQKISSLPTCGPWSSAGTDLYTPPNEKAPLIVAGGQLNPNAIAIDIDTSGLYWTTQGNLVNKEIPGSVKMVPLSGGTPSVVAVTKGVPQGLALDKRGFVLWTDATGAADGSVGFAPFGEQTTPVETSLVGGLLQPAGVSSSDQEVYVTELGGDRVSKVLTAADGNTLTKGAVSAIEKVVTLAAVSPWSVIASKEAVCFGYQGTPGNADGVVACSIDKSTSFVVASGLKSPRALVFETDPSNKLVALYFAELDIQGTIQRAAFNGSGFGQPQIIVPAVSRPSGLVLDTTDPAGLVLYYTSLGDGSIKGIRSTETTPFLVAENRTNPNAVAVDAQFVYWIEGGTPNSNEGAILKVSKDSLKPSTQ